MSHGGPVTSTNSRSCTALIWNSPWSLLELTALGFIVDSQWATRSASGARAPKIVAICCWGVQRSEEHTSELQSLMRISYAVFCLKKKNHTNTQYYSHMFHYNALLDV